MRGGGGQRESREKGPERAKILSKKTKTMKRIGLRPP